MLAREHGAARRHAHHVLRVRSVEHDAVRRQTIDDRSACHPTTVAAERVVSLLIGGDEQDLSTHYVVSIKRFNLPRPSPAAPATTIASASGSMSVEYTTVEPP